MRGERRRNVRLCGIIITALMTLATTKPSAAQSRVSDRDVEVLMKNVQDDVKAFRPRFDDAIRRSTIRKTSQGKAARNQMAAFENQTRAMLEDFKRTKKGTAVPGVVSSANDINALVYSLSLGKRTTSSWAKIRTELSQVANAVGVAPPNSDGSGAVSRNSDGPACEQAVGAERARKLVDECMQVSPATHPPCNAKNSCVLIIDEIKRGCGMLAANAPAFCNEYR